MELPDGLQIEVRSDIVIYKQANNQEKNVHLKETGNLCLKHTDTLRISD